MYITRRLVSRLCTGRRVPLVQLVDVAVPGLKQPLSWTAGDHGRAELWALVGPASGPGGDVRKGICDFVLGRRRPALGSPPTHPFLGGRPVSEAITSVSFAAKSAAGGDFTDYSARYGSIREEDSATLLDTLMETLGVYTGRIARVRMLPDPLAPPHIDEASGLGLFKWKSRAAHEAARSAALDAHERIHRLAPLVSVDHALLQRPAVALSNGQVRRARILNALLHGAELVVLEEPFSGLDAATRENIDALFGRVHAQRMPRVVLVLREQDVLPACVTHVLRIGNDGRIMYMGPREGDCGAEPPLYALGSYDVVRENAAKGIGRGHGPPVVEIRDVSLTYGSVPVLQHISLELYQGTRMVLTGDSGSGKTTLLSLILGDNPRAHALPEEQMRLFGKPRDAPQNAHVLLQRRLGHVSPELFAAFPRKSPERGGLDVLEAVMSGYDGIFTRRARTNEQRAHALGLLARFAGVIAARDAHDLDIEALARMPFAELSHGSQAVVLLLRAMVHQPELLVLDEAFQGMSAHQSAFARHFIDTSTDAWLQRAAIMVVSHYPGEWLRTCGRLLRLEDGVAVEQW